MPSIFSAKLVRDWSGKISANLRRTFTTVNDAAGWVIYENTQRLSAQWTRIWESDGVTGPANDGDNTQRLISVAASSVRGATTATAQSWGLYENADGVQLLIGYTGGTDDIIRFAYSPGGLYARAGTATFLPTAADEVVLSNANSIVNATASLDRTMTIWCHNKDWRFITFRNGAIIRILYLLEVDSLCDTGIFGTDAPGYPPYVGGNGYSGARSANMATGNSHVAGGVHVTAIGAAGDTFPRCRVFTLAAARNIKLGCGEIPILAINVAAGYATNPGNNTGPMSTIPVLQGQKTPLMPIYWSGDGTGSVSDGYLGVPKDWKLTLINSLSLPTTNDFLTGFDPTDVPGVSGGQTGVGDPRTNWWACFGGPTFTWPWRNVAASVDTGL